ncbi:hypothetical protein D3C73_1221580 [compost metagenome]
MRVSAMNCSIGTDAPCTVSNALAMGAGTSPAGNTKLLPGSNATIALTLSFLMAVSQPGPPPCEWVNRMPGPIRVNTADTPSDTTLMSNGPVLGVMARKNCSRVCASRAT